MSIDVLVYFGFLNEGVEDVQDAVRAPDLGFTMSDVTRRARKEDTDRTTVCKHGELIVCL